MISEAKSKILKIKKMAVIGKSVIGVKQRRKIDSYIDS